MRLNKNILKTKIHKTNKWTKKPSKNAKLLKNIRMKKLKSQMGDDLHEYFSAQQHNVLDEIIYKSVEAGVYVAHISTLQNNVIKTRNGKRGVSGSTIKKTVRAMRLHATNEFYIGQIANGHLGAYVFVDLRHSKASKIMAQLFNSAMKFIPSLSVTESSEEPKEEPVTPVKEPATEQPENPPKAPKEASVTPVKEPTSLYGQVCATLNVFSKNETVTKLMNLFEKSSKERIDLTQKDFIYAIKEAIRYKANDISAYVRGVIYNRNNASVSSPKKASKNLPEWYKKGIHKQHLDDDNIKNIQSEIEYINQMLTEKISDYFRDILQNKKQNLTNELISLQAQP